MRRRLAIIAAILVALTLAACGPSANDAEQTAQEFCATHGGVAEVEYWQEDWPFSSSFDAECRDGSRID